MMPTVVAAAATLGGMHASPARLRLAPAQRGVVAVHGAWGALSARSENRLVRVVVLQARRLVVVTATGETGRDVIAIEDARGDRTIVPVRVAFDAGTIRSHLRLRVTGDPAAADWIARHLVRAVRDATETMPGARVAVGSPSPAPSPLRPGLRAAYSVPVTIGGAGLYYDVAGSTTVAVEDLQLPPPRPRLLLYDDDPETVAHDGLLFRTTITVDHPVRLYFYHEDARVPRLLSVVVRNRGARSARVQVITARAGPADDPMSVGIATTRRYIMRRHADEGIVLQIPPHGVAVVAQVRMDPSQVASGVVDLRPLRGGPLETAVVATPVGGDPRTYLRGPRLPGDGHHRTGVFTLHGVQRVALSYVAGGPGVWTELGSRSASPRPLGGSRGSDTGAYGVLRRIDVMLRNPLPEPSPLYLYEEPLGGPVRSFFLVDGTPTQMGCVRVPRRYRIAAFELAPGGVYLLHLVAMTDGGSFYPLRIGVTAKPPDPHVPPVRAPHGCFPK